MTDAQGRIAWAADYKVWGEATLRTVARTGTDDAPVRRRMGNGPGVGWSEGASPRSSAPPPIEQPFRFQGQQFDEETGLHYNRYRYYDPAVGKFASQDPIGLHGGSHLQMYASNPFSWIDPLGLRPKPKCRVVCGCEIFGEGQTTSGKDHASMSEQLADKLAATGRYVKLGIDLAVRTVTGVPTDPGKRPDVTGLRKDGKVDIFEVPSPTDDLKKLQDKGNQTLKDLGNRAGNYQATKRCSK
ncbi:RHS repeat-associated core domain-containing protein [Acidovorax sp. BLS4]|uniref:RHS repeat-associated core domain-containing protein n=1 Tax=Acidovorax sp. BLS4 TaxID=3273430 RepID=UPI00355BECF9